MPQSFQTLLDRVVQEQKDGAKDYKSLSQGLRDDLTERGLPTDWFEFKNDLQKVIVTIQSYLS